MDPKKIAHQLSQKLESGDLPSHEASSPAPPNVADHRLHACIGKGSYGEVWLAQSLLGQWRAVKVIVRGRFTSDRPYEREFHGILQFEPISRSHPGLVHILHVGRDDLHGQFHYIMELADPMVDPSASPTSLDPEYSASITDYRPRTLSSDLASRGRIPVSEVVALGVDLCGALGHIHRHGLVHRDVKPANVIFVGGQAKLADVGLVTQANEARSFVGTEGYIPPEGPGSVRADLYALGKLLYEAATGKRPDDFPELPPDLDQMSDREEILELNEVIARLCSTSLADRYGNAAEVAGDLNLILGGHSVREAKQLLHRLRVARRIVGVAVLMAAVAVAAIAFQGRLRARAEERARTESQLKQRAVDAELESKRQLAKALFEQARANLLSREMGQRVLSLEAIRRAALITNFTELRGEALTALTKPDLRLVKEIPFTPTEGRSLDPKFERVAIYQEGRPVEIRSVEDGHLLTTLQTVTNEPLHFALWDNDGNYLALRTGKDVEGHKTNLELWDVRHGRQILRRRHSISHSAIAFGPAGDFLLTADASGHAVEWETSSGISRKTFAVHVAPLTLRISPDGLQFATLSYEDDHSDLDVYSRENGTPLYSRRLPLSLGLEWCTDAKSLCLFSVDGEVRLLGLSSGSLTLLGQHKAQAVAGAIHPGGRYLITGGWEAELICWDLQRMERAFTIGVNSWRPSFSRNGKLCALDEIDRLQIYTLETPEPITEFSSPAGLQIANVDFSSDGRWLAAGTSEGFQVWDIASPTLPTIISNQCHKIAFIPNVPGLYAYQDSLLTEWRIETSKSQQPPTLRQIADKRVSELQSIIVKGDSICLSTRSEVQGPRKLNSDKKEVHTLPDWYSNTRLSPDLRWLAAWPQNRPTLELFKLPDCSHITTLTHPSDVWTLAFSPQGTELMIATRLNLEVYRTDTWQRVRQLSLPSERQSRILYSPNAETFWHASDRRTAGLRDSKSLEMLLPLPPGVRPLALDRSGERLAVSVDGSRVQIWNLLRIRQELAELGVGWTEAAKSSLQNLSSPKSL